MSLRDDILALPANLRAQRDAQAIADALNVGRVKVGAVTRNQFAIWAGQTGMRAVIEDHATNPASPLRSVALLCRDLLQGGPDMLELSHPANQGMLAAWIAVGALSEANAAALVALATTPDPVSEFAVRQVCFAGNGDWSV